MEETSSEKKKRKGLRKTVTACCGVAALGVAGVIAWAALHKPAEGNHSFRSTHRSDGRRKVAFDTAFRANIQCVLQLVAHGEVCHSYEEPEGFFTGHRHQHHQLRQDNL